MKFRNTVVVGSLFALASGCAHLPQGYPSRTNSSGSSEQLFVNDGTQTSLPLAGARGTATAEKPGLKIRRSKRGNMESYVVRGQRYFTLDSSEGYSARGVASWYGPNFHGRTASNGEVYDMYRLTAAHKTLPLPTYAKVTHMENGRSVIVKINDRGPFSGDRIIDLSFAAALRLGMVNDGTGMVDIQVLSADEMMVLSGPDNKLDIDFYYTTAEGEESTMPVAETLPVQQEELISVAAVNVDDQPITALPITTEVQVPQVADNDTIDALSDELLPLDPQLGDAAPAPTAVASPTAVATSGQVVASQSDDAAMDGELEAALMPVVADASVQGLASVPAAVQSVPLPSGKDRKGYYIQAGVYADVADAERIAVDAVLAAPGEEVHVKPLKDSHMYRITVGPIVTAEHASKVSGKLSEAGLENFTIRVK